MRTGFTFRQAFAGGYPSDPIVRIVPCGQSLLVFKGSSVHLMAPGSAEPGKVFQFTDVSTNTGLVGKQAVVADRDRAYFYDQRRGLFAISDSGSIEWLFEKLFPLIEEGRVTPGAEHRVAVGLHRHKLYVSLPLDGAQFPNETWVLDTRSGTWVRYDLGFEAFLTYQAPPPTLVGGRPQGASSFLGVVRNPHYTLVRLDDRTHTDDFGGGQSRAIQTSLRTKYYDDELPQVPKRIMGTNFEIETAGDFTLTLSAHRDWVDSALRTDGLLVRSANPTVGGPKYRRARALSFELSAPVGAEWCLRQLMIHYKAEGVRACG